MRFLPLVATWALIGSLTACSLSPTWRVLGDDGDGDDHRDGDAVAAAPTPSPQPPPGLGSAQPGPGPSPSPDAVPASAPGSPPEPEPEPGTEPAPQIPAHPALALPNGDPHTLEGVGDRVVQLDFDLAKGAAYVRFSGGGDRYRTVRFLDTEGDRVASLSFIDAPDTTELIRFADPGRYAVEVHAEGAWKLDFFAPEVLDLAPTSLEGTQDLVTGAFWLEAGKLRRVTGSFALAPDDAYGNFIVRLVNAEDGSTETWLFNESGDYQGEKALTVDQSGWFVYAVTADGAFSLKMEDL